VTGATDVAFRSFACGLTMKIIIIIIIIIISEFIRRICQQAD